MSEPTTEAGRMWLVEEYGDVPPSEATEAIFAIEAEARLSALDVAREYLEASQPLLNGYPLTIREALDADQRLREATKAMSAILAERASVNASDLRMMSPIPARRPDAAIAERAHVFLAALDVADAARTLVQLGNQPGADDQEWEDAMSSAEVALAALDAAQEDER